MYCVQEDDQYRLNVTMVTTGTNVVQNCMGATLNLLTALVKPRTKKSCCSMDSETRCLQKVFC